MLQVRKLVLAIAAASALTSGAAQALGLGEVTLKSALNQPLVAEIELLEARDLASTEILPSLASPEAFNKAGVDRQYFLTDLKFTPIIKPNGKSVIRVTSSKAVREPYLNFLVELLWPSGRLLREYTLLLDPPLYTPQPVIASAPRLPIAAPAAAPVQAPVRREPVTTNTSAARPAPSASAAAPVARSSNQNRQYKTTASDTLWGVAQRVEGGTVQQAMMAIQDLNPDAFIDGNINRLKSGQVLRMPDAQQVGSRSHVQAVAQVVAQNQAWSERRVAPARQLDATPRTSAAAAPAQAKVQDNLRLVAADIGTSSVGSEQGAATESKALGDKLAAAQEGMDITRRENAELQSRMGDLQEQLTKLQRLIELKDDQLAKLQADMARMEKAQAATESPVAVAPGAAVSSEQVEAVAAPEAAVAETAALTASLVAAPEAPEASETPAVVPIVAVTPEAVSATESDSAAANPATSPDFNYAEEGVEPAATAAVPEVAAPVAEPVAPSPAVAPVEDAKPLALDEAAVPGFFDRLLKDQALMALVGGGALIVLLLLLLISRRNARREAELHEQLASDAGLDEAQSLTASNAFEVQDDNAELAEVEQRIAAKTDDPLGEAEIFIAYGRFNQAAELLEGAVNDEPNRSDLRLRLMEVYAELGDRDGFNRQAAELGEIGGAAADIDQIKAKYPAIVAGVVAGGVALAGAAAVDNLDDFNFDDLELKDPLADAPITAPVAENLEAESFDLDLDGLEFVLESDNVSEPQDFVASDFGDTLSEPESPMTDAADLMPDFSLDLETLESAATPAEEDFLLDLDLELDAAPAATPTVQSPSQPDGGLDDLEFLADFDLSLSDEELESEAVDSSTFLADLDDVNADLQQLSDGSEFLSVPVTSDAAFTASLEPEVPVDDDEFDFLSGTDETATKLDLARAYVDMGDAEGARDILDEVINEGSDVQQSEARELLASLT